MTAPRTSLALSPKSSLLTRARALASRALGAASDPARVLYPKSEFQDWDYDDAVEAVDRAVSAATQAHETGRLDAIPVIPDQAVYPDPRAAISQLAINRAFFNGDHWQGGSGWIGPHPQASDPDYTTAMNELVMAFTSKNVVREIVKRHASGVVGKPPNWSFVPRRVMAPNEQPNDAEVAAIQRANLIVREWYEAKKVRSLLHDAVCTLLFASRSPLRVYIPAGLLSTVTTSAGERPQTVVRVDSIEQALAMIYPDHPVPEHAAVVQDEDTKLEAGVRLYTLQDADAREDDETSAADTHAETEDRAELVFLTQSGETLIRILHDGEAEDGGATTEDYTFQFGARLTMMEMRRDPLVSPQVAQNQRGLNLALSMLPRNVVTGGFMERVLLNAQMPGTYEKDPDGIKTTRFLPDPLQFGPATTNFFAGLITTDALGKEVLATPDIKWRDPVPVDAAVKAAAEHYMAILDEVSQLHIVLSGDAVVSGKSREQARAEFLNSLLDTRPEAESALRFLLETPLAMAEAIAGKPGELTSLVRVEANCRIDTGPLDATERASNEQSIGRTLSQHTAMVRNGVEDVAAELTRMHSDPLSRATLLKAQGDALAAATGAGMSVATAGELLGLDTATIAKLQKDHEEAGFVSPNGPPSSGPATAPGRDPSKPAPSQAPPRKVPDNGGASDTASARAGQRPIGGGSSAGGAS